MSLSVLQTLGLTDTELTLYELLLSLGETPVAQLIQKTKKKKPTVYKALYSLEKKGLVSLQDVRKKLHAKPLSPTTLLDLAEQKYKTIDRTRSYLQTLLPSLASLYIQSVERPIVQTYEGMEGLKAIYIDILKEGKEGYSILQTEDMEEELERWLISYFSKKRAKKKMPLKVIVSSGKAAKQFTKRDIEEYRFSKIVPCEKFSFAQEVTMYADKVAFMHYKKGEPLIGTIVKHPGFAQTMKAFFNLAWEGADKYTR